MGIMAEIDLERQQSLSEAQCNYAEAFSDYMALLEKFPPAHRKPEQQAEIDKASRYCGVMEIRLGQAKSERYRI